MGIQPAKSFILNPLLQPGAAALAQRGAHVRFREGAIPLGPQAHRQRDETFQVAGVSEFFVKAWIRQDQVAEAFQVFRGDSQGSIC
jgi:hypothetical protein